MTDILIIININLIREYKIIALFYFIGIVLNTYMFFILCYLIILEKFGLNPLGIVKK